MQTTADGAARSAVTSTELCRRALEVYDAVQATAAHYDDPDLGLAISCHLSRTRLASRLGAARWAVDADVANEARRLIASAPAGASLAVLVAWLDAFPVAFLALLNRRVPQVMPTPGGRRAWDRVSLR